MRFDRRLLGWGTFFVLLGTIPLAVRSGYLDAELISRWWSLWPLLLIGWGLGLLFRATPIDWLGGAVTTLTFGVMGGSLIATGMGGVPFSAGCGGTDGSPFQERHGTLATSGTVSVELPCGQLSIDAVDGSSWSLTGTASADGAPRVTAGADGVEIRGPESVIFGSTGRPTWDLSLPRGPEHVALSVTLNAGESALAFDGLHLGTVDLTLNAGKLTLDAADAATLADLRGTVNAGAASLRLPLDVRAEVTVNAGSLAICVDDAAEVRVEATSTFGSSNLDALELEKVGDDVWQTPGYATATSQVELSVTTNAGSFNLAIGGGCGA